MNLILPRIWNRAARGGRAIDVQSAHAARQGDQPLYEKRKKIFPKKRAKAISAASNGW